MALLERYQRSSRRRRRTQSHKRLDIQGLRMVAVLTVFAFHLSGWPRGGFIGVDVFFVISGFLITGNLLRMAESRGNVSFKRFYWNRVRRIVPAATVVLILTYAASVLVFLPVRSHQVGVDALWAFVFLSNWRFAIDQTDYFAGGAAVSPIQHYWSLSIEEQFYFVWPALIFLIGLVVGRWALTHAHRMRFAAVVMGVVVASSLGWALYETAQSPTWAYFNTFARIWELGVGALLATTVGVWARIPAAVKPWLSWCGLGLIGASLILITEHSSGFPAPWAILPVVGSAMVIAAGVNGEPKALGVLRNPASVYVGNISYSLYLVHWPVIVILAALTPSRGIGYFVAVVGLAFGLAIASYHFVENPLRYADRSTLARLRKRRAGRPNGVAALAAFAAVTVGLAAFALIPPVQHQAPPEVANTAAEPGLGPLATDLQKQIQAALQATEWPQLEPAVNDIKAPFGADIQRCGASTRPLDETCIWGPGPMRVMLVGDSIALSYAVPLREIAETSGLQLQLEAMGGCRFVDAPMDNPDQNIVKACQARLTHTVQVINETRPDVVIIASAYNDRQHTTGEPPDWAENRMRLVNQFRPNVGKVVWLSAPPADKDFTECYVAGSVPADCISRVKPEWTDVAAAEQMAAAKTDGVWVDSRPWFCVDGLCPAFVGSTPTKLDLRHITMGYATKVSPVIAESLRVAGVLTG